MAEGLAREGFDLDLRFGQEREFSFAEVLQMRGGHHLELKSDQKARKTGFVFIEYRQKGRPSGIATTKAEWWTIETFDNRFVTLPERDLAALARQAYRTDSLRVRGGDANAYEGVLVPVGWLTQPWREAE